MPNITLSVSSETKRRMDAHPHIRWSNAVRAIIEKKLADFEEAERLGRKSRLTGKDVERLSMKVNRAMGKHAEELLNEYYRRR